MKKTAAKLPAGTIAPTVRSQRTGKAELEAHPLVKSGSQATDVGVSRRTAHGAATRPSGHRVRSPRPRRTTPGVLEQRVAALERELQHVKAALAASQPPAALPWWERLTGSFATDPLFDEMVAAGQAYRRAQNARSRA